MKKSIKSSLYLGLFVLGVFLIAVFLISQLSLRQTTSETSTVVSSSKSEVADYSVEINRTNAEYYILEYTKDGVTKEIYKWRLYSGYGIGGRNCDEIQYSVDKRYFIACASAALVADHQWIPLVFDHEGKLVIDMADIENFPVNYHPELTLDGVNIITGPASFPTSKYYYVETKWLDEDTITLNIDGKIWYYTIGDAKLIEQE